MLEPEPEPEPEPCAAGLPLSFHTDRSVANHTPAPITPVAISVAAARRIRMVGCDGLAGLDGRADRADRDDRDGWERRPCVLRVTRTAPMR
ncbi:hypothetical protein [Catenulispora rubra]|uniref:hypothetical protein n=1 Tax=Catenulispora rubra TaxID=280293 RepID=UPI0018924D21|nr:hypothetical protein [Catenulispora rubra]